MQLLDAPHRATSSLADDLKSALDPVAFARKVGVTPDPWQADVLRSNGDRILLCSRQSGKSTVSAVIAMHEAIYNPGSLTLLLAPVGRQSQELLGRVRTIYGEMAEEIDLETENKVTLKFENGSRIIVIPDREGNIRGFSEPGLIIIDEAAWVMDSSYMALRPMLAVSQGRLLLLSTPFGKRGFFHREWAEGGPDWHRSRITADQCLRISPEWLAKERTKIPAYVFAQEYMCEFVEGESQAFTADDVLMAVAGVVVEQWAL